jgi:hypothetical protein
LLDFLVDKHQQRRADWRQKVNENRAAKSTQTAALRSPVVGFADG